MISATLTNIDFPEPLKPTRANVVADNIHEVIVMIKAVLCGSKHNIISDNLYKDNYYF